MATHEKGAEPAEREDGDESSDGEDADSDSETEVVECEDEEEFEEVMRILGLQPAKLDDNGDLRLPNGVVAAHRDVAHIYRQRGQHFGQLATIPQKSKSKHCALMMSSSESGQNAL